MPVPCLKPIPCLKASSSEGEDAQENQLSEQGAGEQLPPPDCGAAARIVHVFLLLCRRRCTWFAIVMAKIGGRHGDEVAISKRPDL